MRFKGRHWAAVWLVTFLAVTWLVYARQTAAIHDAGALVEIRARRANLEGHRAELERRIRTEESRADAALQFGAVALEGGDRKSTRLNSSHDQISYAAFRL